jgi:predicted RecA/RadA family phage recombinase
MAKNFVQSGMTMNVLLAVAVTSGDAIVVGNKVVVAAVDGKVGDEITMHTVGVWSLPKVVGAIAQGAPLYLTSDGEITLTNTDNTLAGYAFDAAGASDATVNVKID